jgi:hypothetical protein
MPNNYNQPYNQYTNQYSNSPQPMSFNPTNLNSDEPGEEAAIGGFKTKRHKNKHMKKKGKKSKSKRNKKSKKSN